MFSARPLLRSIFTVLLAGSSAGFCGAQALPTATRGAEISAFGGYSPTYTDFNPHTYDGFMFGGDFTLSPPHWWVSPSLEFRYTHAHSPSITEHAYLAGPRIERDFGRFRPYVDVLVGQGTIIYHPVVIPHDLSDGGISLAYGAGLDFDVTNHVSIKGDFLQQNWNLGTNYVFQPDGGRYTLTPWQTTVGAVYHFDIKGMGSLRKQRELR